MLPPLRRRYAAYAAELFAITACCHIFAISDYDADTAADFH